VVFEEEKLLAQALDVRGIHSLQNCCVGSVVSCPKRWAFQSNYRFKGILWDFALGVSCFKSC
jgi:hypothetical protein